MAALAFPSTKAEVLWVLLPSGRTLPRGRGMCVSAALNIVYFFYI